VSTLTPCHQGDAVDETTSSKSAFSRSSSSPRADLLSRGVDVTDVERIDPRDGG